MDVSTQILGLDDLDEQLERLIDIAEQEKYAFAAAGFGLTPIIKEIKRLAPQAEKEYYRYYKGKRVRKNNLKRKKKYSSVSVLYNNVLTERVGRERKLIEPGGLKNAIRRRRVKLDRSIGVAVQIRYGKAFYWRFLEYGTPKIKAVPFIRPAFDSKKQEALERFKQKYRSYIEAVVRRQRIDDGLLSEDSD